MEISQPSAERFDNGSMLVDFSEYSDITGNAYCGIWDHLHDDIEIWTHELTELYLLPLQTGCLYCLDCESIFGFEEFDLEEHLGHSFKPINLEWRIEINHSKPPVAHILASLVGGTTSHGCKLPLEYIEDYVFKGIDYIPRLKEDLKRGNK